MNFDIFIFGNPVALNLIEVVLVIGQSRDFFEKSYKLRSIKVKLFVLVQNDLLNHTDYLLLDFI